MTDEHTENTELTGLNLFNDKASAAGSFPHAMLGYDKLSVDSYVRELESELASLRAELRQQTRENSGRHISGDFLWG